MYYLDIICSLYIPLNLVLSLIFDNPYIVLGKMCLPSLIGINPSPNHPNPQTQLVQYITTIKTSKLENGPTPAKS